MLPTFYELDGIRYPVTNNYNLAIRSARKLGYDHLGTGRHRMTYDMHNGWVLKLPHCANGTRANQEEAFVYRKMVKAGDAWPEGEPVYASCKPVVFSGVLALHMEKVDVDVFARKRFVPAAIRAWVGYVDCGQVGWTKDGRLVAFDYSYV